MSAHEFAEKYGEAAPAQWSRAKERSPPFLETQYRLGHGTELNLDKELKAREPKYFLEAGSSRYPPLNPLNPSIPTSFEEFKSVFPPGTTFSIPTQMVDSQLKTPPLLQKVECSVHLSSVGVSAFGRALSVLCACQSY